MPDREKFANLFKNYGNFHPVEPPKWRLHTLTRKVIDNSDKVRENKIFPNYNRSSGLELGANIVFLPPYIMFTVGCPELTDSL